MNKVEIGNYFYVYDGPHATPTKTDVGPIYLGIKAISEDGFIDYSNVDYLSEKDYIKWTKRVTPTYGDMVFSYEATLHRYALVPDNFYGCLGRRLAIIRPKNNEISIKWLYYYFKSNEWKNFINSNIVYGSTVNRISIDDFPSYKINFYERKQQEKIVAVLDSIDKKIQNNKKIIAELEDMAKTLYMHSFFRKTPNGKLSDIIINNGKSNVQVGEAKGIQGEYPFFTSGASIYEWNESLVEGRNCFLNTGGNADVKFYVGKSAYSTDTWCITAKDNLADYLYMVLSTIKIELNQKYFQGTGLKHLQKDLLQARKIYIPSKAELEEFNSVVVIAFNNISERTKENQELTDLRDWLLPMLMNGQVVVE